MFAEAVAITVFGLGTMEARVLSEAGFEVSATLIEFNPTAALDSERAGIVMDLLRKVAVDQHAAILAVTHDEKIYNRLDHIFHLRDGRLGTEEQPEIGRMP